MRAQKAIDYCFFRPYTQRITFVARKFVTVSFICALDVLPWLPWFTEGLAHYGHVIVHACLIKPDHISCYLFRNKRRSYDSINSNREILFYEYRQEHWEKFKGRRSNYEVQENRV